MPRPVLACCVALAAAPLVLVFYASGRSPATPASRAPPSSRFGAAVPPPDSEEVRERAEDRQRRFEERRRSHLGTTWGRTATRCDEIVGRFCLWHEEGGDWEPPEEPEAVRTARLGLLAVLDSAAATIPGDPWVAGQRVRYLLEAGRTDDALAAARACRASEWWCAALAGLAHHRAGRYRRAERSFARALDAMGRDRACRWRGLDALLEGELRDRFEERPCGSRSGLRRRIWWLADPMYLVPGNDRRSEHFARWVLDRTQRDSETPSGVRWGEDLQELLIRYGWPVGWERDVSADNPGASVISHYPDPARRWLPGEWEHVERPASVPAGAWPAEPPAPRSEHAPSYVRAFGRLEAQVARFRRGDSSLVVAAYRLAPVAVESGARDPDTARVDGWVRAGLYLDAGPAPPRASSTTRTQGLRGVLAVRSDTGGHVLSLETLAPADSVAARLRRGVRLRPVPDGGVALSDLLLVEVGADSLPERFAEVFPRAVAGSRYRAGDRVGIYWELYGEPGPPGRIRFAVTLERGEGGFFSDVGDLLGLWGGRPGGTRVEWSERLSPGRVVHPRSLVVRLPADLPEDDYLLRVEAASAAGDTATARRRVRVRRDG